MGSFFSLICKKISSWIVYPLLIFPALVFSPWQMNSFEIPKAILFLSIVIWLMVFFVFYRMENRPQFNRTQKIILWLMTVFFIVKIIVCLWSTDPRLSFWGSYVRMEGAVIHLFLILMFVALLHVINSRKQINWYLATLALVATIISAYGDFQKFGMDFKSLVWEEGAYVRIASTLGNPLFFSLFLTFSIVFTLYLFFKMTDWRWRAAFGLAAIIQSMAFVFTFSSSAIIGMAGLAVFLPFFYFWDKKRLVSWLLIGVTAIGLVFAPLVVTGKISGPLVSEVLGDFTMKNLSNVQRVNVWGVAWKMFEQHPWFGWGQEMFLTGFSQYKTVKFNFPWESNFDRAHNIYFDYLAMEGIFSFLIYLAILIFALRTALKRYYEEKDILYLLCAGLIFAYAINTAFSIVTMMSLIVFYLVLAIVFYYPASDSEPAKPKEIYADKLMIPHLIIMIAAIIMTVVVVRPWRADLRFMQATRYRDLPQRIIATESAENIWHFPNFQIELFKLERSMCKQTTAPEYAVLHKQYYEKEQALINRMISLRPYDFIVHMAAGMHYETTDVSLLAEHFAEAARLAPNHLDVYRLLGDAYSEIGNQELAVSNYLIPVERDPGNYNNYRQASMLFERFGNTAKAEEFKVKAAELEASNPQNL